MRGVDKQQIISGIANGDTRMLSRAITLAESTILEQRQIALDIIEHFGPQKNTFRIGITGTPGAGKSTFIEAIGTNILENNKNKVAVLSVDPSSEITKGSILGDKTRMANLSANSRAFIRPTASGNQLGGLAKNTRLAMLLCEAAGYNIILIESVGVGQGETEIAQLADLFVLLLNPGGGDELQGIKRGIMEMADIIVVNKADGDLEKQANLTAKEYSMALHLHNKSNNQWLPKVITASAINKLGIEPFWRICFEFEKHSIDNSIKTTLRERQKHYWTKKTIQDLLLSKLDSYDSEILNGLQKNQLPERLAEKIFNRIKN